MRDAGGGLPVSGRAVASLVLGICSLFGCGCYGVVGTVCGILAIVYRNLALADIAAGTRGDSSAGLAKAGMVCGIIGLSFSGLFLLVIIVAILI